MQTDITIVPAGNVESLNVFGIQVDIHLTSEATGGVFSIYRATVEPGMGSPFHVHLADDETFTVVEGTFEFRRGDTVLELTAGGTVFLPRQIPHYFKNIGAERGVLLGINTPGGHENFFREAHRLGAKGGPVDMEEAIAVTRRYGMELLPDAIK